MLYQNFFYCALVLFLSIFLRVLSTWINLTLITIFNNHALIKQSKTALQRSKLKYFFHKTVVFWHCFRRLKPHGHSPEEVWFNPTLNTKLHV